MTTTAKRLGLLLPEMMSMLHARVAGDALADMHASGLTLPQMIVLHILKNAGSQPIGVLAGWIRLSASATSHLVDRLFDQKLVRRTEDPTDRRQKIVAITPKGEKLVERLAASRSAELSRAVAELDPALQTELVRIVETVMAALRTAPAEKSRHKTR